MRRIYLTVKVAFKSGADSKDPTLRVIRGIRSVLQQEPSIHNETTDVHASIEWDSLREMEKDLEERHGEEARE